MSSIRLCKDGYVSFIGGPQDDTHMWWGPDGELPARTGQYVLGPPRESWQRAVYRWVGPDDAEEQG